MIHKQHDFGPIAIYRSKYLIVTVFGLLVGFGFFLAAIHSWFYLGLKSSHYPVNQILNLGFRMSIAIPLGAYLMSRLLDLGRLVRREITFSAFLRIPGFALWGGLFSGMITILITTHQFDWDPLFIFDAAAFGLPLAQMFGRVGCLNYGCCHGRPHNGRWSIQYQNHESKVVRTYSHFARCESLSYPGIFRISQFRYLFNHHELGIYLSCSRNRTNNQRLFNPIWP